ncbi:DUF4157 domain-containing protein [Streptomyces sp. SID13726]|nr:DUF4157 domain-containing protein [Streptomyces sp. SID13726]
MPPGEEHAHGAGHGHEAVVDASPAGQKALLDEAMASPSRSLPGPLLSEATPFFQNPNLAAAQLHDNPVAQRATAALGAQAMTVGTHIFAPPQVVADKNVMGHELSHVNENLKGIPETGHSNGAGVTITDPNQSSEQKADKDGAAFGAGAATAPSLVAQGSAVNAAEKQGIHEKRSGGAVQRAPEDQRKRSATESGQPPSQRPRTEAGVEESSEFGGSSGDEALHAMMDEMENLHAASQQEPQKPLSEEQSLNLFTKELMSAFRGNGKWKVEKGDQGWIARTKEEGVSKVRKYDEEPEVEGLRWISSVIKAYMHGSDPVEVQAAIGEDGKLVVAANSSGANKALVDLLRERESAEELLLEMVGDRSKLVAYRGKPDIFNRADRHYGKAEGVFAERDDSDGELARHHMILSAIGKGLAVAAEGGSDLHAELRIVKREGGKVPPYMGGTKRPCASCFTELYPGGSETVRPGVFYFSKAVFAGTQEYANRAGKEKEAAAELFTRIDKNVAKTYKSATHRKKSTNSKVALALGTGSESEGQA